MHQLPHWPIPQCMRSALLNRCIMQVRARFIIQPPPLTTVPPEEPLSQEVELACRSSQAGKLNTTHSLRFACNQHLDPTTLV